MENLEALGIEPRVLVPLVTGAFILWLLLALIQSAVCFLIKTFRKQSSDPFEGSEWEGQIKDIATNQRSGK